MNAPLKKKPGLRKVADMTDDIAAPPADPRLDFLFNTVGYTLRRAFANHTQRLQKAMRVFDIAPGHFISLFVIGARPGITLTALAAEIGVDASRAVVIVDELERRGLATRVSGSHDKRVRALHLTPAGQAFAEKVREKSLAFETEFSGTLTQIEKAQLLKLLNKLVQS
jgi:DNA-binding MarR family transcriptional regulator